MPLSPGTYSLGPDNGELLVHTRRTGAAAKAGHDLVIEVTDWRATLDVTPDPAHPRVQLTADGGSLKVREGRGGMQALGDDDKQNIAQTIDDEVLKRTQISFTSTGAEPAGDERLRVQGELELLGHRAPIDFELAQSADGRLTASAVVKQTAFGMKPYSALLGTLKVVDEVEVTFAGQPGQSR